MSVLYIQRTWEYNPGITPLQVLLTYAIEQDGYAYVDPPISTSFTIDPPNDDGVYTFSTIDEALAVYDPWVGGEIFATANTINNVYDSFVVDYPDGYTQIALTGKQTQSDLLDNVSALSLVSGDIIYSTGSSNTVGKFNTSSFMRGIMSTSSNAALLSSMAIASTNITDFSTAVPSAMSSTLTSYVTASALTSSLGSYVTSSSLSSNLSSYATTSSVTSALAGKQAAITPGAHISAASTNSDGALSTSLTGLSLLTIATQLNATNGNANDTQTSLNALVTKFNTLLTELQTAGILASS